MNAGFITPHRALKQVGIHQRFDVAAYRMIERYLPTAYPDLAEQGFPAIKTILSFEGYNGPDGLKVKSPKVNAPSHLYDPATDTGEVPTHISNHYAGLVRALVADDEIRAAFEAAWLAHFVCDGMTPAHHWPLEEKIAEAAASEARGLRADTNRFASALKKYWKIWGVKGHLSTHHFFETGIALALLVYPIRPAFSDAELARARELGPLEYFKAEAREIAALGLYEQFYRDGWTNDIAVAVKNKVAPLTARAIGIIWLLALLEAGQEIAVSAIQEAA